MEAQSNKANTLDFNLPTIHFSKYVWGTELSDSKEEDNKLYLRYNAIGIPADRLAVREEFVNKSGEMYLTCEVECEDEFWGDKKKFNVRYRVDTDVYESWESFARDGYLVIVLNERVRERPDFHRA